MFVCSLVIASSALALPPLDVSRVESPEPGCAHAKTAARMRAGALAGRLEMLRAGDTDVLHYHLDIEIDPVLEWIGGSNTMTVRSLTENLTLFRFRLQDVFDITQITAGGFTAAWQRIDSATLEVTLDRAYGFDEVFEVKVEYDGIPSPPSDGFGSIEFRTRGGSGGAKEVWTLSEPWFAHTWWPAKDDNTDKTTADLWFTVPDTMVVASNGVLQGVDPISGGLLRYRWKTEYQTADYLYCIGATNYNTWEETWTYDGGTMPLNFYIYPEDDTPGHRNAWRENLDMLDVFTEAYGLYPFVDEKYGMCQVGFGGGMEHQTMTSQGGFWESITAHELAHQWFGDMITCATWHDIWLNEGFATYSEAIWWGGRPGSAGMSEYHDRMDTRRPSAVDDSVYCYDISSVNRIFSGNFTYRKAAWVLHMLRHVLGDDAFFDAVAAYRSAYEYDSATTEGFQAVMEASSGRDLTWFIDEWVYDIGAPAYRSAWRAHTIGGRDYIEVYLRQVQSGDFPVFVMPVDVKVSGAGPNSIQVIWNDEEAEHFLFETTGSATGIVIDPEVWILATSNSSTAFVEGPPKVVTTAPEPGETVAASVDLVIEIVFHKDVVAEAGNFTITGDVVGEIPFDYSYDSISHTAVLEPTLVLAADGYRIDIDDAIVDAAAGLDLDGEVATADDPAALPSGDGLPGGDADVRFTVSGPLGDIDGDGIVGFSDLLIVLSEWGPCGVPCPADIDGNGEVGFSDLLIILSNWT